jgi:uncharacterized protein YndB with AHSA1/START domain
MHELTHRLDRSVVIQASRETVFRYFTDSARWAKWWGAGSTIDPRVGGGLLIRHADGTETVGEVLEVKPPEQIAFTYGYASGKLIPPGGSRVTIALAPHAEGTLLRLQHEFADQAARDHHVQGWRFQLSVFANVVADEVFAASSEKVDAWFEAWAIPEDGARAKEFARIASPGVRFRDRYSLLDGLEELTAHSGAAQRFMPGIRMRRAGEPRHCQGVVLADWGAVDAQGQERMSGTNVFVLGPDGRFESVTGVPKAPQKQ